MSSRGLDTRAAQARLATTSRPSNIHCAEYYSWASCPKRTGYSSATSLRQNNGITVTKMFQLKHHNISHKQLERISVRYQSRDEFRYQVSLNTFAPLWPLYQQDPT